MNRTANRLSGKPRIRLAHSEDYQFVHEIVSTFGLTTVCQEARCPNLHECWDRRTATIMILGDTCTRSCGFCSVKTGEPQLPDPKEPHNTARAVKNMGLRHVVITSVDRDDLKEDYGADIWTETVHQIHHHAPNCTVEILTPDFQGNIHALQKVFESAPDIFSHNIECVERISRQVRPQANWQRSLEVLKFSVEYGLLTKTGIMVGLGETKEDVIQTMKHVVELGVKIFTVGQYLQPTKNHIPVDRYVNDEEFSEYKNIGLNLGFSVVESGALVRSSYHADVQARLIL
ncbi:MAG: lipoyl synthase [Candidatus Marinimicrobia bacterium]|nr:lipoyl synthase [Candidatus Neomarinimicrobiota bacterium]MBL7059998.1 lipoyl synthase [Candidatus Neomarinimicrobiota bacterium]